MRVVTAHEHDVLPVGEGGPLSTADARVLIELGRHRPGFCTPGYRSVKLAQYAGLVALPDGVLEILPKVGEAVEPAEGRGVLLRLLHSATRLAPFTRGAVGHDLRSDTLLDVFIAAFLDALLSLVRRGLLRRYVRREEDLPVVRGRLRIERQASVLGMRVDRLACRYDELTADNPHNRVLVSALLAVGPLARHGAAGRTWLEVRAAMDDIRPCRDPVGTLDRLVLDRQARHYAPALKWAGWILRLLSPTVRAGRSEAPELLFDMNRLFEEALGLVLHHHAQADGQHVTCQDTGRVLASLAGRPQAGYVRLRPDYVLREAETTLMVGDAKWARAGLDRSGVLVPEDSHAYQLNAYASAYDCEDFVLFYPWHRDVGLRNHASFELAPGSKSCRRLHVCCVDIGEDGLPLRGLPVGRSWLQGAGPMTKTPSAYPRAATEEPALERGAERSPLDVNGEPAPPVCPRCGADAAATILYGLPSYSAELKQALNTGEVVLGGCCISDDNPDWQCRDCTYQWAGRG